MRSVLLLSLAILGLVIPPLALQAADEGFDGRWVIEPHDPALTAGRVLWLEIEGAETANLRGKAVGLGPGGQLDNIVAARIEGGELHFHVERETGRGARRRLIRTPTRAKLVGGELHGVSEWQGKTVEWVGRRAPVIEERDDGSWKAGDPVVLFDGTSLDGWDTLHPGRLANDWRIEDGVLKNREGADVLVSKAKFWNYKLHAEYLVFPRMNGGIGLRGRYEIQILDDHGAPPTKSGNGALYSRIPPSRNASKTAGEWQRFDITLIGRDLTVVLNGETIIDKGQVEGFTAMATDWREGEPGPITLQGDHGAVEFRKIVVTPLEQ